MPYQIKLEKFEGPLGLLLEMIEKRKLSINEVSLAEVTEQYINHLKNLEGFPLPEVSNFVSVASTLMLIKSASLIPSFELTEEEAGDIKDLEKRLQIYAQIRSFGVALGQIFGKNIMFGREAFLGYNFGFLEPKGVTITKLHSALKQIIANLPVKEILPKALVKKTISLEKKITEIIARVQQRFEVSFSEAFSVSKTDKIEIIVSFLAVLELVRRGFVVVEQTKVFDSIRIKKNI
jgi:segregation and condensation protein A